MKGAAKATPGTHKPDRGNCGGKVKDNSCNNCGADNIARKNIKADGGKSK